MSGLEEFLIQPENCLDETRYFEVERFGKDKPVGLKVISNAEHSKAMKLATNITKDGKVEYDNQKFLRSICLAGIVEPRLTDVSWMEKANEVITKYNADEIKKVEDKYKDELEKWEKEGSDPKTKPTKGIPDKRKTVSTPAEMLELVFRAGEIDDISSTILKISGFGTSLKELDKEAKN